MIQYWPQKQGIILNNAVAQLLKNTKIKLDKSIFNKTNHLLYLDIIDHYTKRHLFQIVITQLEYLLLDIIELNLKSHTIKHLKYKILKDIINKTTLEFAQNNIYLKKNKNIPFDTQIYPKHLLLNNHLLIDYLLNYLIFGASNIQDSVFMFDLKFTPQNHVKILLENFIIEITNLIAQNILDQIADTSLTLNLLNQNKLCSLHYISSRSLAMFKNNLFWQNVSITYIYQPKEIYSSKYRVWLFSDKGLIKKYIFLSRSQDINKLNKIQIFFLLFLEIQDIVIPQLENIFLITTKILIYIIVNVLGNSLLILIRTILSQIKKKRTQYIKY
uniref:Ycf55 n=1 Tax=Crouania attenuata TaxID=42002 RepID=A0A4D6WPL1_9FLOR|nr:hypothetical protein [Crouania attenuata]